MALSVSQLIGAMRSPAAVGLKADIAGIALRRAPAGRGERPLANGRRTTKVERHVCFVVVFIAMLGGS
jgi:hypothetical protein